LWNPYIPPAPIRTPSRRRRAYGSVFFGLRARSLRIAFVIVDRELLRWRRGWGAPPPLPLGEGRRGSDSDMTCPASGQSQERKESGDVEDWGIWRRGLWRPDAASFDRDEKERAEMGYLNRIPSATIAAVTFWSPDVLMPAGRLGAGRRAVVT
jgi:hypothetical protein